MTWWCPPSTAAGDRVFTYVKSKLLQNAKQGQGTSPSGTAGDDSHIYVWQSFSGHHLAQLAPDGKMADAFFGYDEATGNVLVAGAAGSGDGVRVIPTRKGRRGSAPLARYTFDETARAFTPETAGAAAIPARQFSDNPKVETKQLEGGGVELSYQLPGATDKRTFRPGTLAVDALSTGIAAIADDGSMIAAPVVSQTDTEGAAKVESPPAMLVWQANDENLDGPRLMARVSHKSEVVGAMFLGGSKFLVTSTKDHGVWLSAWHLDDLRSEICRRLAYYDLGTSAELRRTGSIDVSGVCSLQ